MPAPTYPASSDVAATNKTRASHYNNLRKDALRLGADTADALNIGDLLARYIRNVRPAYLATNRIRIPYNSIRPPSLVVGGYILKATADIDLAASSFSGGAATWYIFANRVAGSTTFTLTVNTSATEGADQRRIGSCYWDGSNLDQGSIRAEEFERDIYFNLGADAEKHTSPAQGDMYLTSDTSKLYLCFVAGAWVEVGAIPPSLIAYYDGASAPSGWSILTGAQGRVIVGMPTSGTLAGTVGSAMTDLQNPTHTHTGPSHQHTLPIRANDVNLVYSSSNLYGIETGGLTGYYQNLSTYGTGIDKSLSSSSGTGATSATSATMPYIQYTPVKKD